MTCNKGRLTRTLETCSNIQKENLDRNRVVLYAVDSFIIHMNPDGDGECESSDMRIGLIVHQLKAWTCSCHSHCDVNDN